MITEGFLPQGAKVYISGRKADQGAFGGLAGFHIHFAYFDAPELLQGCP